MRDFPNQSYEEIACQNLPLNINPKLDFWHVIIYISNDFHWGLNTFIAIEFV